jgi:serine/threonine protein phosphatase PrpC
VVANAGDSRAVLCRRRTPRAPAADDDDRDDDNGAAAAEAGPADVTHAATGIEAVRMSTDHTPDLRSERERIEKAGGMVLTLGGAARVCCESSPCMLAVSRALGDRSLKFGGTVPRGLVTDEPECTFRRCDGTELLLVIVSDGVTDVLDDKTIARTALNAARAADVSTAEEAAVAAAEAVVKLSAERDSPDDITAVVTLLHDDAWKVSTNFDVVSLSVTMSVSVGVGATMSAAGAADGSVDEQEDDVDTGDENDSVNGVAEEADTTEEWVNP